MGTWAAKMIWSAVWLSVLGIGAQPAAWAGHRYLPSGGSSILEVDKPIAHLGDTVTISGLGFAAGARVAIDLHGLFDATLGKRYGTVVADARGRFRAHIRLTAYPDKAAHDGRTVMIAAIADRSTSATGDGAAVAVQVDPVYSVVIPTQAPPRWSLLTVNGIQVMTQITRVATGYRLSYLGYLRAGTYSAYLKWLDGTGVVRSHAWTFHTGSPYDAHLDPRLKAAAQSVRLGGTIAVSGQYWSPGATVIFSIGGPNIPPSMRIGGAVVVEARGEFHTYVTVPRFPDGSAKSSGAIMLQATATGAPVGDLPEMLALSLQVTG